MFAFYYFKGKRFLKGIIIGAEESFLKQFTLQSFTLLYFPTYLKDNNIEKNCMES